jgi:hypothetical protein
MAMTHKPGDGDQHAEPDNHEPGAARLVAARRRRTANTRSAVEP